MNRSIISKRIKILRTEEGMTQKDLAAVLGVGRTAVNSYETGQNGISNYKIKRLAEYFNVSTDYIMGKTDIRQPLREKDKDIRIQLELLVNELINSDGNLEFDGKRLDNTTKTLLIKSLVNTVELARAITAEAKSK